MHKKITHDLRHLLYLAQVVEARDPYTAGHLWRVSQYSKLLAKKLGLTGDDLFHITLGAYLHDVGKIVVPDHVLNKKGALTEEEFAYIKTHSNMGYEILKAHYQAESVAVLAHYHHEHWNGEGYPDSLKAKEIPFAARLLCITDSFDAMTSNRPYRKAMSVQKAKSILEEMKGVQFDPELTDVFLEIDDARLEHIVGHSDDHRPLLDCPVCGPVIEVPDTQAKTLSCRVCTGQFDIERDDKGQINITFNGRYASPEDLLAKPDMNHIDSVFSDISSDLWEKLKQVFR